jgi:hypothetical protein
MVDEPGADRSGWLGRVGLAPAGPETSAAGLDGRLRAPPGEDGLPRLVAEVWVPEPLLWAAALVGAGA